MDGTLHLALLCGFYLARHNALRGRPYNGHEVEDRDSPEQEKSGLRIAHHEVADAAPDEAKGECAPLADPLDNRFNEAAPVEAGAEPDEREGGTDGAIGPAEAVIGGGIKIIDSIINYSLFTIAK